MQYRKFNHLHVPETWQHYFTKYPQGHTILESLIEWVSQVDSMVDQLNENTLSIKDFIEKITKLVDDFLDRFGPHVRQELIDILREWQQDGTLDVVISEALQTQIDKLETHVNTESINVKYPPIGLQGAKGDGVEDDTTNIQNIINYAYSKGTPVFFPKGNYKITSPIKYRPYMKIYGAGVNSKIVSHINNGYALFFDKPNENLGPHGVSISNIFIDGKNHTGTGGALSVTSSGHGMVVEKCWFSNFSGEGQCGIYGYGDLYYFTIKECNIQNDYIGIRFDGTGGGVNNCGIENCKITSGATGISLLRAPNTYIKNCQIEAYGIGIDCRSSHTYIETCWLEQNTIADIRFTDCKNSHVNNVYTYRVPSHVNNYSINFNNATNCSVSNSFFNSRTGGNAPVYFGLSNGYNTVNKCMQDASSTQIYEGALGHNEVIEYSTIGVLHRSEYPTQFTGGVRLSQTSPATQLNGILYDGGVGVIKIEDSIEKRIPALSNVVVSRSAAPTTGDWNRGDIVFNTTPSGGGSVGWVCTVSGKPGTWRKFGGIEST